MKHQLPKRNPRVACKSCFRRLVRENVTVIIDYQDKVTYNQVILQRDKTIICNYLNCFFTCSQSVTWIHSKTACKLSNLLSTCDTRLCMHVKFQALDLRIFFKIDSQSVIENLKGSSGITIIYYLLTQNIITRLLSQW